MKNSADLQKQKNSGLSLALIAINTILALILTLTGRIAKNDPDGIAPLFTLLFSVTILLGAYAFTYNGKAYRWSKWVFGMLLILSLACLGLLWYLWQLGKGYRN